MKDGASAQGADERLNVLITGVTSTVGLHLAHRLYHDRRIGKIFGVGYEERPRDFDLYHGRRFIYQPVDILRARSVKNLFRSESFRKAQVRAVVHLTFVSGPGSEDRKAHRLNVEGTRRLLDESLASRYVRKFIFRSSDVVYKLEPNGPVYLDERAPLNFDVDADPWIKNRVDADMICRAKLHSPRIDVVVLRVSSMIGGQRAMRLNAFWGAPIQFRSLGFDPLINLTHVSDVVQAIELSLFKPVKGVYNIAGGDTAPISALATVAGANVIPLPDPLLRPVNWLSRRLGLTRYYYPVDRDRMRYSGLLDIRKAQRELGFVPHAFLKAPRSPV